MCLPARAHLVHDSVSDPLTLALCADKIFQSRVSSSSAMNHISSAPVLGEEYRVPYSSTEPAAFPALPLRLSLSVLVSQVPW